MFLTCFATRCKIYTRGDGWEGDCESSGDNSDDCKEGDLIWIRDCYDDRDFKFEILKNYGTGDQIRVSDTNLCFETYLRFLELRPCDVTNERQLWNSIDDLSKFELRPYVSDKTRYILLFVAFGLFAKHKPHKPSVATKG